MEKISSILPSNSRVKSVDLEDSHPVRPGTPTFGRKEGWNSAKDKVTLSSVGVDAEKGVPPSPKEIVYKNPREVSRAKMVEEVNRKFFNTRLDSKVEPVKLQSEVKTESVLTDEYRPTSKNEYAIAANPKASAYERLANFKDLDLRGSDKFELNDEERVTQKFNDSYRENIRSPKVSDYSPVNETETEEVLY